MAPADAVQGAARGQGRGASIYRTTGLPLTMPWMIPLIEETRHHGSRPVVVRCGQQPQDLDAFTRYLVEQGMTGSG